MMIFAHDARGVTQAELAATMYVGQATLSKYETGFLDPPSELVGELSAALQFPEGR